MEAWLRQAAAFAAAMSTFGDEGASEESVLAAVGTVRGELDLAGDEATDVRPGFEHWVAAFAAARAAATRDSLKDCVRFYLCTPGPHDAPPHNISQGMMKATVHLIWRKLYAWEAGRPASAEPRKWAGAITPREQSQEFLRAMYAEIAAEGGETVDAMMERVCGGAP